MKKQIISLLAALAMLFTLLPAGAVTAGAEYGDPAYTTTDGKFKFTVSEGKATIVACGESAEEIEAADGVVTVPKEVAANDGNAYPVIAIGDYAFSPFNNYYNTWNCTEIQEIKINAELTRIGADAFWECSSLRKINIPKSVTEIEEAAFQDCTSLEAVVLPDAMKEVPVTVFSGCSALKTVRLPAGAVSIGDEAFYGCESLTQIDIPDTVTKIGDEAFWGCTGLEEIELPKALVSVGVNLFMGCSSLKKAVVPAGVTKIPESFFDEAPLEEVTLAGVVTQIDRYAFSGCEDSLTSIVYGGTQEQWNDLLKNHTDSQGNGALKSEAVNVTCTGKTDQPTPTPTPDGPAEDGSDGSSDSGAGVALVLAAGVAGGVLVYHFGTELYLKHVLPAGAEIPATRAQLAELVWTDAGKPEPAAPLAEDAPEDAKALTWAEETGLMQTAKKNGEAYAAEDTVSRITVIRTWNKAQELKKAP